MPSSTTEAPPQPSGQTVPSPFSTQLEEVKSFDELVGMVPALLKMRGEQKIPWGGESSNAEFTTELLSRFNAGQMVIWAKLDQETNSLDYFMAVIKEDKDTAMFWLFYIDIKLRAISAELTKNSIDKIKAMGYKKIQLTTRRLTKSYSRWMGKLGFKPLKLLYEKELTHG